MTLLASETGGGWIERTNDVSIAFERVADDAGCFYRLGFPSRDVFTGNSQRITVRITDDRRYRLRYRRTLGHRQPLTRLVVESISKG